MAKLSREDVLKLAKLAKLELTQEELDEFSAELPEIIAYVEKLQAVDTSNFATGSQTVTPKNVTRLDVIEDYGYSPEDLLKQVPSTENNQIKVRRMLG